MSALARRAAFSVVRTPVLRRQYASGANPGADAAAARREHTSSLAKGARKDPELYVLWIVMGGALGLAGWYFSSNPTTSSSERAIGMAHGSEPWKTGGDAKYEFHPHGDTSRRKEAPSALNEVIIPNVNLPKELHEKYNKWGKEGY